MRNCFFVWVGGDGTCFCVCKSLFCFNLPPAFQWVFSKSTAASGTEWPERFQLRLPPVRGGLVRQRQFLKAWLQTARFFFVELICVRLLSPRGDFSGWWGRWDNPPPISSPPLKWAGTALAGLGGNLEGFFSLRVRRASS